MTSPIVFNDPGWGSAVQEGLTPVLVMLQQRKELALQQQKLAQEQQRINLEEQRTQSSVLADAAQRKAAAVELKQRQLALDNGLADLKGKNDAAALYSALAIGKRLEPGTPEWNQAFATTAGDYANDKKSGAAFVNSFHDLVKNHFDEKHQQSVDRLQAAQTAEANAKAAADAVKTTEASPGTEIVTTSATTGKEINRVPGAPANVPKPTLPQLQNAAAGTAALSALRSVRKLPNLDAVEREVGGILNSKEVVKAFTPLFSSDRRISMGEVATLLAKAKATPQAQAYMRRKIEFMDQVALTEGLRSRLTGPILQQLMARYMPSSDALGNAAMHENEKQAIAGAMTSSGYDINPDIWMRAAKRSGVADVTPDMILADQFNIDPKLEDIRKRNP